MCAQFEFHALVYSPFTLNFGKIEVFIGSLYFNIFGVGCTYFFGIFHKKQFSSFLTLGVDELKKYLK